MHLWEKDMGRKNASLFVSYIYIVENRYIILYSYMSHISYIIIYLT